MPDTFMQSEFVQSMLFDKTCYDVKNECDVPIAMYHWLYDILSPEDFNERFILLCTFQNGRRFMKTLDKPINPDDPDDPSLQHFFMPIEYSPRPNQIT